MPIRQLKKGFVWLRFTADMEREYQDWGRADWINPAILCAGLGLIIWLGFAVFDLIRLDFFNRFLSFSPEVWTVLLLRWIVAVALAGVIAAAPRIGAFLPMIAMSIYLLTAFAAAASSHVYQLLGLPRADIALLVIVVAAFLPIGLSFYQTLAAAVGALIIMIVTRQVLVPGDDPGDFAYLVLAMVVAVPAGAIGGYLREFARREQFLLRNMLRHQAHIDSLTDLANRRMFVLRATEALDHAKRAGPIR